MTIDNYLKMFLNHIWLLIASLFLGDSKLEYLSIKSQDSLIKIYQIRYQNNVPVDTTSTSIEYYDSQNGKLIKKEFYNQQKVLYMKYKYIYDYARFKQINSKEPKTIDVLCQQNKEMEYVSGKLASESIFNEQHDLIKKVSFIESGNRVIKIHLNYIIKHLTDKRILTEEYLHGGSMIYVVAYRYNKLRELTSKTYSNKFCCDENQDYPVDKIIYKYNSKNQIVQEDAIVDWRYNKKYKKRGEYLTQITEIKYLYNQHGKLCKKIIYQPLTSLSKKVTINHFISSAVVIDQAISYDYIN